MSVYLNSSKPLTRLGTSEDGQCHDPQAPIHRVGNGIGIKSGVVAVSTKSDSRSSYVLTARMVLPLGMALKLRAVEVDIPQVACTITQRLIIEVARRRMTVLTTRSDGLGAHLRSKLDYGDEAVSVRSVALLGARERARSE